MVESWGIVRQEILQVADTVAREKGISANEVIEAMEQAIQKTAKAKYGFEQDIRATINRKTGEINLNRHRMVVEEVTNEFTEISSHEAVHLDPAAIVGTEIIEPLPPIEFGRVAAQTAKQVIVQHVRRAERYRQYMEYKDRQGEIVHGVVKRVDYGNVTIDLGKAEALLRREEMIPRETFRPGDRVRSYLKEVRQEIKGPQLFLSRTCGEFMEKLFLQEVPEIYDGIIEIKSVARDPGSRAKLAVYSRDSSIDPVGSCVGMRGSRVQGVVNELQGEKVDIILWSSDIATFVVNALAPAEIIKVVMDDENHRIEVIVADDQLSLAIGRRGQNVRLASGLTHWNLDITTESDENIRRSEEIKLKSQLFLEALDVDEVIAHLLVNEGFTEVEEIAYTPLEDFLHIEGFDAEVAQELIDRAKNYLEKQGKIYADLLKELTLDPRLMTYQALKPAMLVILGQNDIKTLEDFADLSNDELVELLQEQGMNHNLASHLIMAARKEINPEQNPQPENLH